MKSLPFFFLMAFIATYINAQEYSGFRSGSSVRVGFTQATVPFGVSSDKPGSLFSNNDFNFYLDDEFGLNTEYQLVDRQPFGLQVGGFYYHAAESDRTNDGAVEAVNQMTLEGGGVYAGITWKAGWERIGVRTALNAGYFTFDYRMKLSYMTQFMSGFVTEYKGEAVSGPGTRIDAGGYAEFGRIGLYPSFQMLFVAKNGPSAVILKALNVSLGYRF